MIMVKKSKFADKFKANNKSLERTQNIRDERKVKEELPLICFNFKDFDRNQIPPGQSFEQWQKEGLLSKLLDKLTYVSQCNITEAQQRGYITIYKDFPEHSDFKVPKHFEGNVNWAVIKDIGGQKVRVAGYVYENVFYVVSLDKDHKFFKMKN